MLWTSTGTTSRLDAQMAIPAWRLHDLRRTCVTGMGELGVPPHVIERTINHVSGHLSGVAGTYNRSKLMPERRAALQKWADHVTALVDDRNANVVPLRLTVRSKSCARTTRP